MSKAAAEPVVHPVEMVPIERLTPHPRNYRAHPPDQLAHIARSIVEHGFYRNVVCAVDYTILAGHGVVEAAPLADKTEVPVVRLELQPDDPRAIKVLTGDNELGLLADVDDRLLSELLKEVYENGDLLGTGYDEMMLANLAMVTRPISEIQSIDHAAHWLGMPDYDAGERRLRMIVLFDTEKDRDDLMEKLGNPTVHQRARLVWSIWWPDKDRADQESLRWQDGDGATNDTGDASGAQ